MPHFALIRNQRDGDVFAVEGRAIFALAVTTARAVGQAGERQVERRALTLPVSAQFGPAIAFDFERARRIELSNEDSV